MIVYPLSDGERLWCQHIIFGALLFIAGVVVTALTLYLP